MSLPKPMFLVHVQSADVAGEVQLNGAPILPLWTHVNQDGYPSASEWVVDGENTLSVHVTDSGENPRLHVAVCRATIGDDPLDASRNQVLTLDWPPPAALADVAAPALPPVISVSGPIQHGWGQWSWQRSPPFSNDRRTIDALVSYVRDLHASLAGGSIDTLVAHSRVVYDEVAPIYDFEPSDGPDRLSRVWSYLNSRAGFELAEFDEKDLDLRVRCGGQLIEPRTLDGAPIIRQEREIDGELWSMPIFIARTNWEYVAGELTIVRY